MSHCLVPRPSLNLYRSERLIHCHSGRASEESWTASTSLSGCRLWSLLAVIVLLGPLSASAQLPNRCQHWLDEDVSLIISSRERAEFLNLSSNEQRQAFIIDFWERRNPSPGAPENKFKQEHYRRIAYANAHFAYSDMKDQSVPGWKTDRGRIYILYGSPDSIDNRSGGDYQLASGIKASTDPYVLWQYKSIKGIGENMSVRFVDKCRCGNYRQSGEIEQTPAAPEQ
jgi:GWxTD domain-containing protein